MLRCVAFVRTDISEEHFTSIISLTRIGKLGITLAATNNQNALQRNTICTSKMLVLTRTTWCNIPEDGILHQVYNFTLMLYCQQLLRERNTSYSSYVSLK
jgi:hypothetical protein